MRAVVQRVSRASVSVDGEVVGSVGTGFLILLGVGHEDTRADATALVDKLLGLRVFPDEAGRMNRSVVDVGGEVLVVSQFTLLADLRKGRRPSFTGAAKPEVAEPMVDHVIGLIGASGITVASGRFAAMMDVALVNDGPVTLVLDIVDGKVR
jgi:D-tyrosyl-tRNA(Tyr) deacylase